MIKRDKQNKNKNKQTETLSHKHIRPRRRRGRRRAVKVWCRTGQRRRGGVGQSRRAASGKVASDRTASEKTASERTASDATELRPGDWGGDFSKLFKILHDLLKPPSHTSMPRLGMPREPGARVGGRNLSPCGPKRDFCPASAEFVISHRYKMATCPRDPRTATLDRS